jgi:hypothetical protein
VRNFVIFFEEKEGTTPLIHLLEQFQQISIVRQSDKREPFDEHVCGPMTQVNFQRCLELIFNHQPADMDALNAVYTRSAAEPLAPFDKAASVGFKMRFVPNKLEPGPLANIWLVRKWRVWRAKQAYRRMMIDLLSKFDVLVFLAVRQDIFRWALSKYHGDGTGKPGHLQFDLATGKISEDDLGKIHVDAGKFEALLQKCERAHARKQKLMADLRARGVTVQPLCYEDFLADKPAYLRNFLQALEIDLSAEEIESAIGNGTYFKKVHSDDISEFVENHEEVKEKFGDRFVSWR